ncbi:DUF1657 domain-containing protein [Camelliibacillus cellulosilyticus]|uniref:DUF1657 domain-containing protein n=1 Tax=Camelliibacillus cellulosilyticus TaxID=2174486 RepID=A0ABV9GIE6_9BACL
MTIAEQIKQTIGSLKSVEASFELFSYQTKDTAAKQAFTEATTVTQQVIDALETRLMIVEKEEPQYKTSGQKQ